MSLRQTLFSDVCGTVDELKHRLGEGHAAAAGDPAERIEPLLADAEFMAGRMTQRLAEYQDFREKVREALAGLDRLPESDGRPAEKALGFIRQRLERRGGWDETEAETLSDAAEEIRSAAVALENRLRSCKDLALSLYWELIAVKGNRPWLVPAGEGESVMQGLKGRYQAWIPPGPHCEKLLECLSASRAHVLDERLPDGQPVVQFEDGGAMPMSQVRWDEEIKNFRPASFKPGYRET